ncbi:hydroxysqualene dehydroxylase HpnE [Methylophaga thiooxydans]|uniref:hydroxysqualene dehydroxylase HpnE n=1 Tax=Methylophaga thiooxydans TaxID=392484 RepID=UPI002356735D|nr:hydroxysqualene dehydroxylase HpnE [Methylophaga thiooxydans]
MTTLVVGGGWSGLATAVRLTQQGETVHLLEAAKQLGGRARNVAWQDLTIDNGQHLLIGAYQHTLAILNTVGAKESDLFQRQPLKIAIHHPHYPTLQINAGETLPWPASVAWRLWKDNGFAVFIQVSRLLVASQRLKATSSDLTVKAWLTQHKQSLRLTEQLWEPLCLAMLNTPIDCASAKIFSSVLVDTFKTRQNTDLLIPTSALGDCFPRHAAAFIQRHGGKISLQARVKRLKIENNAIQGIFMDDNTFIKADKLVIATSPTNSKALLSKHLDFEEPGSYPIATIYLLYPSAITLPETIIGMSGTSSQWLFDRQELKPGLVAVVISGPGEHEGLEKPALVERVAQELKQFLPQLPAMPKDSLVIREKRATFACNVDIERQRPNNRTEITGLWLAGDYIANGYPATLEGAIINGVETARQLIEHQHISR